MIDEDYNIVSDGFAFNIENITHLVTFSLIICTQSKIFIMTFNIFKSGPKPENFSTSKFFTWCRVEVTLKTWCIKLPKHGIAVKLYGVHSVC